MNTIKKKVANPYDEYIDIKKVYKISGGDYGAPKCNFYANRTHYTIKDKTVVIYPSIRIKI